MGSVDTSRFLPQFLSDIDDYVVAKMTDWHENLYRTQKLLYTDPESAKEIISNDFSEPRSTGDSF